MIGFNRARKVRSPGAVAAALALGAMLVSGAALAQTGPSRAPATGIPIVDCEPSAPAPSNSCTLRVPPGHEREQISSTESESITFAQPGDDAYPADVTLSATLLLVDLTPGPRRGRAETFAAEKNLLVQFAERLPENELVAVFGFNESLERLADFTTDRDRIRAVFDGLELRGSNTRIATHMGDVIRLLGQRDDVIFRNLVVISDGEEEGLRAPGEITEQAIAAGVSVSTLGMFWRPLGSPETAEGMDYLSNLTDGTLGASTEVQLRRPQEAADAVAGFIADMVKAREAMGLIVPDAGVESAQITVGIREPVPGSSDQFTTRELEVVFTASAEAQDASDPAPEALLFGQPANVVYTIAAIIAALMVLAALFVARRLFGGGAEPEPEPEPVPEEPAQAAAPAPKPAPKPVAFLVRMDSGTRYPVAGQRVSIGRAKGNLVVVEHDSVSRNHAELHRNRDGGFSITDMGSLNGTFLNEKKITGTSAVKPGDILAFGEVKTKLVPA